MKKFFLAILAVAFVSGALAQEFPDVPEGSYAADAVERLAELGIVIGFPDGTFRGNEAFTRYQAALVVTRLLDVIEADFLSAEDLDTVRNALQEIASDVSANTERVAALEEAIAAADGADADAVEELQNELEALRVELDTALAAAAASEALEQQVSENTRAIEQLGDLVRILNEDIAALGTGEDIDLGFLDQIEANTGDIANLREFVVLLRQDEVALRERVTALEASDEEQTARLSDLETRVTALEEAQVAFSGSIGLEYDVGRLSGDEIPFDVDRIFGVGEDRELPPSVFTSGEEDLNDDDDTEDANEEAQDRQDIEFEKGNFSPVLELNVDFSAERGLAPESGLNTFESTVVLELVEATVLEGDAEIEDPEFNFNDPNNYLENAYVFQFSSLDVTLGPIGAEPITFFYGPEPGAAFSDYVFESLGPGFRVDVGTPDFLAFLQPTLQIAYGVYQENGDADADTLELPTSDAEQLAFNGAPVFNPYTDAYYRGIRGTLTPFATTGVAAAADADDEEGSDDADIAEEGTVVDEAAEVVDDAAGGFLASTGGFSITGGFSVAQLAGYAAEHEDAAVPGDLNEPPAGVAPNADITVYGLDGQVNLSIFNVEFEYAANQMDENFYLQTGDDVLEGTVGGETVPVDFEGNPVEEGDEIPLVTTVPDTSVVYANLTVDTAAAGIPLLESLEANYRSIPELWYGLKYDEDTYPWELDQRGFGAEATLGLSIFRLTGFYDTYTVDTGEEGAEPEEDAIGEDGQPVTGSNVAAYGVRLGAEVYRAVEVFGFYTVATLDGTRVFDLDGPEGNAERNDEYVPGLGVGVEHDGEAENALVPGLNFSIAYDFTRRNFTAANVDTQLVLGAFTLSPYVSYTVDVSPAEGDDDVTALEAGTGLSTEPIDVFLQPSFAANVNYRSAQHTDVADVPAGYTAEVLQYSFGVTFNQFLLENSNLALRYGSFTGTNIEIETNLNGEDDNATDISDGDAPNTGTQTTNGYEVLWNYYGLEFGYGAYLNTRPGDIQTGGQRFSVSYTVNF